MANTRASTESLRASLSQSTPIPTGHIAVQPEDEINADDPVESQVHDDARDLDDEDEDEKEEDSACAEIEDNGGRDDLLSKITEAD